MKQIITLILSLVVCGISYGQIQKPEEKLKNTIGVMFSPGYKSSVEMTYTVGLRGVHPINKYFGAGLEIDYQQFLGPYGNSDALGGIGFARFKPCKHGFFSELGFQYAMTVSSARSGFANYYSPYLAIGYKKKVSNRMNFEFHVRPFTNWGNPTKNEFIQHDINFNILSKCFFGLNYSF